MLENNLVKVDVNGITNTAHDNSIKIENIAVKVELGDLIPKLLGSAWGRLWGKEKIETIVHQYLQEQLREISPEALKSPELEIAVPVLQALVYCGENEDLRGMYLRLLASSMEIKKEKQSHRAYVQIINQLSPLEARLIAEFRPKENIYNQPYTGGVTMKTYRNLPDGSKVRVDADGNEIEDVESPPPVIQMIGNKEDYLVGHNYLPKVKPIVSYTLMKPANSGDYIQSHIIETSLTDDDALLSSSMTNLLRLGLIEVDYKHTVSEDGKDVYAFSKNRMTYVDWDEFNHRGGISMRGLNGNLVTPSKRDNIHIIKGNCKLTQFGYNFIGTCVIEADYVMYPRP